MLVPGIDKETIGRTRFNIEFEIPFGHLNHYVNWAGEHINLVLRRILLVGKRNWEAICIRK